MIDSVLGILGTGRQDASGLGLFSQLMLESTFEQSLEPVGSRRLAAFFEQAFGFLLTKPRKSHAIRLRDSDLLAGLPGQPARASVIEILNDDMPFVVDSVLGELHSRNLVPRLVFHPIFKVARHGSGRLTAVEAPGDRAWADGGQESYIAILLDPIGADEAPGLLAAIEGVLRDVRNVASDGEAMHGRLDGAIAEYDGMAFAIGEAALGPSSADVEEAVAFLKWLAAGSMTLMGVREYEFVRAEHGTDLQPASAPSLGVFRDPAFTPMRRGGEPLQITPEIRAFYDSPYPIIITKANAISRVRRRLHLDYVGIKRYAAGGRLVGEIRVLGLFTPTSYQQPVEAVPLVRRKVRRVLEEARFPQDSHNWRTLIDILENFPRDELFQIDPTKLKAWSMAMLDLELRPRTRVLARRDEFNRYYSILVFVPRDLYSSQTRERIGSYLSRQFDGRVAAFYPSITSSPLVRTQFIIALGDDPPDQVPDERLERDIVELLRTWPERLAEAISTWQENSAAKGGQSGAAERLVTAYRSAFSGGYVETFPVERAVEDIARIERLSEERPVAIDFYREPDAPRSRVRTAVYRFNDPIPLSQRVPVLENLGFRVIDERSYRVKPAIAGVVREVVLHDMVLETTDGGAIDLPGNDVRMEEAFLAVFRGEAENDPFNALVVAARLDWREAAILRAYAAYLGQIRAPFGRRYIAETLVGHAAITRDLFELFRTRFGGSSAGQAGGRSAVAGALRERIEAAIAGVKGLDEDRILRRMLNLVLTTVRANAFRHDGEDSSLSAIAFKIDSRGVDDLPEPRPFREIFVYSPRVEGIHLRFAAIARGGIRWSDRVQDYRTEVLGLAKAQQVKNTVIVPTGAKGGFVPKQIARDADRDAIMAEGEACYRIFISALLSLTDNIVDGQIVPPAGVVRHDADDPYLVVAADKGTATFSDIANGIAIGAGFWLGDAFASGGSAGYDHKRMGITARGAWECVKRHFQEIDVDIGRQPFRVVGVGDMSGDVFGNGMLLSPAIKLVAAFDHRDIFLDPDPEPARSLAERRRLFELPRSSWTSYDAGRLSKGGGVFPRSAKSVPLSAEVKALLGVTANTLTPNALIQAILRCETDLLWFGGIGTYIRDSQETDEQIGDRSNDAIRITAPEVRAKVIGEGANLGVTQRGRIELARNGVRLNTDFIDNSAGVNTSDQEVNIKIALAPELKSGKLTIEARDKLLADMAGDVATAVLINNYQQSLALSLAERTSRRDISYLAQLARQLEERGLIVRKLEVLPSGAEFAQRAADGGGLARPELAVLMSWAKIALNAELLAGPVPDEPASRELLLEYFPAALRERFSDGIRSHRLGREIVATRITNSILNRGGPAVMVRLAAETGRSTADISNAFMTTRSILSLTELWAEIDRLDGQVPGQLQLDLYQRVQDLLVQETANLLKRQAGRSFAALLADYRPAVEHLARAGTETATLRRRALLAQEADRLASLGVPAALATRIAELDVQRQAFDLADRAAAFGASVEETARAVGSAAEYLGIEELEARAAALEPVDEFDTRATADFLSTLRTAHAALADRILHEAEPRDLTDWARSAMPSLIEAKALIDRIIAEQGISVARLAVVAAALRAAGLSDA